MEIEYKGPLISDTGIPGEGKSEGTTPEISCCVQASRDKWLILFGTLDPRGWDTKRAYCVRQYTQHGFRRRTDPKLALVASCLGYVTIPINIGTQHVQDGLFIPLQDFSEQPFFGLYSCHVL